MTVPIGRALRIAAGHYTPFLVPPWTDATMTLAKRWLEGADVSGARVALESRLDELAPGSAVATSSGRGALALALTPFGGRESEVIIPSFTCGAVADAVLAAGCIPVLADVDEQLNLSAAGVEAAWSPSTVAVVVVHLGGVPAADARAIASFAHEEGAVVVEDAAHAMYADRARGWADATIFSTGLGKTVFGPGGGALVSTAPPPAIDDEPIEVVRRRLLRFVRRYAHPSRGRIGAALLGRVRPQAVDPVSIARCSDIDAAIAMEQLDRIEQIVGARRTHASRWGELLEGLPVTLAPREGSTCTKVWAMAADAATAAAIRSALWRAGIETEDLYTPLHRRRPYERCARAPLPVTEATWNRVFTLPARPGLTERDWKRIERAVARIRRTQT